MRQKLSSGEFQLRPTWESYRAGSCPDDKMAAVLARAIEAPASLALAIMRGVLRWKAVSGRSTWEPAQKLCRARDRTAQRKRMTFQTNPSAVWARENITIRLPLEPPHNCRRVPNWHRCFNLPKPRLDCCDDSASALPSRASKQDADAEDAAVAGR